MGFLSKWPDEAPRDKWYMLSTYPEEKARELFVSKYKSDPQLNFSCGGWRYVGPINTIDK